MTNEPNEIEGRPRRPAPRAGKHSGWWRGVGVSPRVGPPTEEGWPAPRTSAERQAALVLRAMDRAIEELARRPLLN